MDFNLILTTYRHKEEEAIEEAIILFERAGDRSVDFVISKVSGIVLGYTNLDQFEFMSKFRQILMDEPWQFRYILRIIPIERSTTTDLKTIQREVENLVQKKISFNDTYRITVEKRHTEFSTNQIINYIANKLQFKVCLDNPDWIILIQVIGNLTGISIIKKNQIFNSVIEKRNIGLEFE